MTHLNYADAIALVGMAFAMAWVLRKLAED